MTLTDSFAGIRDRWFFLILFPVIFLFTHLRQNSHTNFDCEICSDKAGYYFYLPATFQMGYHTSGYPDHFDADHGEGFHFDTLTGKIKTKFTCGVALLQAPFYLIGAGVSQVFGTDAEPYSRFYLLFINIGLAFYTALGLIFFRRWLSRHVSRYAALVTTLVIFFGTNLMYYVLDESLMSHAYSFFLLCTSLYFFSQWKRQNRQRDFYVLAFALALALLIRPTNVIFAVILFFIRENGETLSRTTFSRLFTLRNIAAVGIIFFIVFLPQMLYWKFAYGKLLTWSYENEGFFNWNHPWFRTVWFSPQSGLFPYAPIVLVSVVLAIRGAIKKEPNSKSVLILFLLVSYMCAAWSNPTFGVCNFGKRPFVEYLPLLLLPVAMLIERTRSNHIARMAALSGLLLIVGYNFLLFSGFNTCFQGGDWDWNTFFGMFGKGF